jgi:hypothetical protein
MKSKIHWIIYPCLLVFGVFVGKWDWSSATNSQSRNISSVTFDETNISKEAHHFREELYKIKTTETLVSFLSKHISNLETHRKAKTLKKLPADYRLLASFLYPLKELRGIGYRVYGLTKVKKSDASYSRTVIRNILNSKLQGAASLLETYYPGRHQLLFSWITEPAKGQTKDLKYIHDIQNFAMDKLYANLQHTYEVINSIEGVSIDKPITLDSALLTGNSNALPIDKRYYNIYPHGLTSLKGSLQKMSHDFILFSQYNRDDIINFKYKEKRSLFSGLIIDPNPGYPMVTVVNELNKWKNLYTLREISQKSPSSEKTWLQVAYSHAQNLIKLETKAYKEMENASKKLTAKEAQYSLLNPKASNYRKTRTKEVLSKRNELINNEQVAFRNWITGDNITISYSKLYTNPPQDLRVFLPIKFNTDVDKKITIHGERLANYKYGVPTEWNLDAWQSYFPSVKSNEDIKKIAQTLNTSSSGRGIANIVSRFVSIAVGHKVISSSSL